MGARILILQEHPAPARALQQSLGGCHELIFAQNFAEAMRLLLGEPIDLIIARVHLEKTNVFDFLKVVKANPRLSTIPFICFCGRGSAAARVLDPVLAKSSEALGADKYLSVEDFRCGSHYDLAAIKDAVESCLHRSAS